MTCDACLAAEKQPTLDDFRSRCMSCEARALAVTGCGLVTEDAAQRLFGDRRDEGLRLVGEWVARMKRARARA
jgi:hypothetical protein